MLSVRAWRHGCCLFPVVQIGPLIPTPPFAIREPLQVAAEVSRPTFAQHLRQIPQDVYAPPAPPAPPGPTGPTGPTGSTSSTIPFGQYLREVNRVDRAAARLAEAWAPSAIQPRRLGEWVGHHADGPIAPVRAVRAPIMPDCRPAPPVVIAVYQPPLVLHRGARVDLVG